MNELQKLNNPDNLPNAVTTGYQRQNINITTIQTGIDTTEPYDDANGKITIPVGGIIETNGVMFKIVSEVTLNKPNTNIAYWIEVVDNNNDTASFNLVTRPGTWDAAKQGCYNENNRRTLNWVSLGNSNVVNETSIFSKNVKGTWYLNLKKGWYLANLSSGYGGGDGTNGALNIAGKGGVANKSIVINRPFFHDGKRQIVIKVGGSGWNGGDGSLGIAGLGGGGGGGSGRGEATSLNEISTGEQLGGNGGKGGNNSTNTWVSGVAGGGGGGGENGGDGGDGGGGQAVSGGGGAGRNGNGKLLKGGLFGVNEDGIGYSNGGGTLSGNGSVGKRKKGQNGAADTIVGFGGGMGDDGVNRLDGEVGGYCNIFPLGNIE